MVKNITLIAILLATILATSCEKIELGEEIEVKLGETYKISWNLSFEVDSINDYRCPIDVVCIWPGDVDLYFDFGSKEEILNLNNRDNNPFFIKEYSIEILNVEPYPTLQPMPGYIPEVLILLKVVKD